MKFILRYSILLFSIFQLISCYAQKQEKEKDYLNYYLKVYKADSLYVVGNYDQSFKTFKQLFKEYRPINQMIIRELETYMKVANKVGKLDEAKPYIQELIAKWGYEPKKLESSIKEELNFKNVELESYRKTYLNQYDANLRDSIIDMIKVDQIYHTSKHDSIEYIDRIHYRKICSWLKNNDLSVSKIGYPKRRQNTNFSIVLIHVVDLDIDNSLEELVFRKVKEGKLPPYYYALMVDRRLLNQGEKQKFYSYSSKNDEATDEEIKKYNLNRKKIGLYPIGYLKWRIDELYK